MAETKLIRDHHLWTRDTIKNVSGDVTLDIAGDLTLDAGVDVNIPANVGLTFGDDGEKIEGDGVDLTISSSRYLTLDTAGNIFFDSALGIYEFMDNGDPDDKFKITVAGGTGATTLETVSDAADGHLTILADGDMSLQTATAISMHDTSNNIFEFNVASARFTMFDDDDISDWFRIAITTDGASTISTNDDSGEAAHLTLDPDGDINLNAYTDVNIPANIGLTLGDAGEKIEGNGTDLFINSSRHLTVDVAGALYLDSTIGSHYIRKNGTTFVSFQDDYIEFDGRGVGFDLVTPTYNASDTDVDFRTGNKQFVTFGSGNIADLNLKFPSTSGNFTLLLKQDGTAGSRTVAADGWLVFDSAGNAASGSSTVKFAGGSNPTLTTDANHVDIISFFWDADNEIAYGVASLDFQF